MGRIPWSQVNREYIRNDAFFFTSLRGQFWLSVPRSNGLWTAHYYFKSPGRKRFYSRQLLARRFPSRMHPKTVAALAEAIESAYHNPQERLQMSQAGYQFAKTQVLVEFKNRAHDSVLSRIADFKII